MRAMCKFALAIAALPLLMGADVYRWVDADGVVNFTQQKPQGFDAERVRAQTGERIDRSTVSTGSTATPAARAAGGRTDPALDDQQRSMLAGLEAAEQARRLELAKIRDANCQQARTVLEHLSTRGRIRVRGDDGSEQVMPEEERQQRIAEAQRGVAANCSAASL
ncbi:MAG: DUF4124 domain-containing protein [Pseudomonadales bacterium]